MSHFFPAYIGKPPPHVLRKRKQRGQEEREREREEREREERDRELSPAVPDPEPSTPAHRERANVFGTPTRSVSRVRKTYAHKRVRSFATPRAGAGSDGEQEERSQPSSREPSSSRSPTKVVQKNQAQDNDPARPAKRPRLNEYDDDDMYADPPTFEAHDAIAPTASPSHSPVRRRKSSVYVEIQTPLRRSRSQAQQDVRAGSPKVPEPPSSTRRPRGRPPKVKPIAIPTPSTTSEEGAAQNVKRRRPTSGAEMTLSEALNQSFAQSIASSPAASSSRARRAQDQHQDIVEPTSIKRGPGRPRGSGRGRGRGRGLGRGRGRGAASSVPLVSHDVDNGSPPASAHESEASLPTWTALDRGAASSHRPPPAFAREEEESSNDELASVTQAPVKRTPGRPRRPATPGPSAKAADTPTVKRRGRPPGTKNQATIAREAAAAEVARRRASLPGALPASSASIMANYASTHGPPLATPVKRGRGRPRKSAPEPSVFGLDTVDYMEPLKDPDADADENPFRRRTRSQSRQGRGTPRGTPAASPAPTPRRRSVSSTRTPRRSNSTSRPAAAASTSAAPKSSRPPSHSLDMKTMQRRPRARSASTSPSKRRARPASAAREMPKATEFQTRTQLCNALKRTLLEAPMPKLRDMAAENAKQKQKELKEKEKQKRKRDADRLRVAPSGVLFFGGGDKSEAEHDDDEQEEDQKQGEATVVFSGSWSVLADPAATFDDSLAMKTLHEVVMGVRAYIELDKAAFAKSDDGQTISVTVPCGCMSVRGRDAEGQEGSSSSSQQPPGDAEQCAGEMAVSVTQEIVPEGFSGVAKAMRMTVMISHY